MKFTCSRVSLAEALSLVSSVIPTRSAKPVLQNVQIRGNSDSTITLSGTDLDIGISYTLEVENLQNPGVSLISAHKLTGVVQEDRSEEVTFEINPDSARMLTGRGNFEFSVAGDEEFPDIRGIGGENIIEIPGDALADAVGKTGFATAKGDSRYALNGICLNIRENIADFVASDTHRLSLVSKKIKNDNNISGQSIVITKGMQELARLAAGEEAVRIQISGNELIAATSRATLISRLVDGQFPRYQDVVPKESNIRLTFVREEVMHALRLVGRMSNEESHSIKFDAANEKLNISATTGSVGSGNIELDAKIEGGEISSSFNYIYMLDALKSLNSSEITLNFKSSDSPVKVEEGDYTHVIMPITARR